MCFETNMAIVLEKCPPGTVFLAAVSGGADSMAMLAALAAIRDRGAAFCLRCIHVEHGIRPPAESRGDAELVRDFCEKLGIECRIESIPPGKIASFAGARGIGIEAAARFFRRRALFREARRLGKTTRILTAHTRDDLLETVLMRVLRGAGPAGLAAMPGNRGRLLRPLLPVNRADVLEYLTERNIPWREDSTNTDVAFFRNRIRHQLVPLLNESFPSWKSGVAAMADTQSLAAAFIRDEARRRIEWKGIGSREWGVGNGGFYTDTETFFSQPEIIREEALFQGIDQYVKKIYHGVIEPKRSVIRRFCAGSVNAADLGPMKVCKQGRQVVITALKNSLCESGFSLLIKEPGFYNLKSIAIEVRPVFTQDAHQQCGADGFYACLPLVFRQSFKDDFLVSKGKKIRRRDLVNASKMQGRICAADRMGTAAFIGSKGLLAVRDLPSGDGKPQGLYTVRITNNGNGGTDA
jgi:tRNA(Ile)-lysidine synthase